MINARRRARYIFCIAYLRIALLIIATMLAGEVVSTTAWAQTDSSPPTVQLGVAPPASTNEAFLRIRGVARDDGTGVTDVEIHSVALELTMAAALDDGGNFTFDLPLEVGENRIEITAIDGAGLRSAKTTHTVTRSVPAVPSLVIDEPVNANGTIYTSNAMIDLRGRVWTSLSLGDFSIRMGVQQAIPLSGPPSYSFQFDDIALALGTNTLEIAVFSPFGSVRKSVIVERIDPNAVPTSAPPQIALSIGQDFITIDTSTTILSGTVTAPECITNLLINGLAPDQSIPLAAGKLSFQVQIAVPANATFPVVIEATGCNGQVASQTVRYVRDDSPPLITLQSPGPSDNIIRVVDNPVRVLGTIDEAGLVGAMLNGFPLSVEPDAVEGRWRFDATVKLDRGRETPLVIAAWDRAGQRSAVSQRMLLESAVEVDIMTPDDGDQVGIDLNGSQPSVDVTVQVREAGSTDIVFAAIDSGTQKALGVGEGLHGASLSMTQPANSSASQHTLNVWVQSPTATVLARSSTKFSSIDLATVPIALIRQEPPIGAVNVETDAGLTLYFNRQVNSDAIEIQVRETVRGVVFRSASGGESDLRMQSNVERVTLDRTHEPVVGRAQNLPGNRAYSFFPAAAWNYGATIEIDVLVNGNRISQSNFTVRKFPSLLHGFVTNEMYEPLAGIEVLIPDLGFSAISDANGVYNFGWGWPATKVLPSGIHRVVINPQGTNPRYGMIEGYVEVVAHELNHGPSFVVPWIPNDVQFSQISGGQRSVLSEGRLILGLEQATLDFNSTGANSGTVAPHITEVASCGYAAELLVGPLFALRLEPGGIAVQGPVTIDLALPQIGGSFNYLDALLRVEGSKPPLILFGLEPGRSVMWPLDVLEVDTVMRRAKTTQVHSRLQRLDVLAVALVPMSAIPTATKYLRGEASFTDVLAAWYAQSSEVTK